MALLRKQEHHENSRLGVQAWIGLAFTATAVVVVALLAQLWKMVGDADEAKRRVVLTHEMLQALASARASTLQAELATQGFRISGASEQLADRDAAHAARERTLSLIRERSLNRPSQLARWQDLRDVVNQRMAISRRIEELRKAAGNADAAGAFAATAPLRATRVRIHQLLDEMEGEASRSLQQHIQEEERTRSLMLSVGKVATVLLLLTLASSYALIRRQLQRTEKARQALAESEERLSTTLSSIGDAVLACDEAGRIARMNRAAELLTGWTMAEASGHPVEEVLSLRNEVTREPVPLNEPQSSAATLPLVTSRTGDEWHVTYTANSILTPEGLNCGSVLVLRDATAVRIAQKLIEEQNLLLEERVRERTEQLLESEDHLRSVISNVPAMIAFVDATQRYVYVNRQYLDRFAPGLHDIAGLAVREVLGEQRYTVASPLIDAVLAGNPQNYDWQPFPGVWQAISYVPKMTESGTVVGYYVLGADITERKQSEAKIESLNADLAQQLRDLEKISRALRTISAGNRTMLRSTTESELLSNMCEAIVAAGAYDAAVVWLAQDDSSQSIKPTAESGYPAGLTALQQLPVTWADNERGQGAVSTAIRTGATQITKDMQTDPAYAPWRRHLNGMTSVIACPLRVDGRVIGALALYDREPGSFGSDEVQILSESADDLAFGVQTLRHREAQKRAQETVRRLTHFDALTDLPNEVKFGELLHEAIRQGQISGRHFSVMQTSIGHLRDVNDALGFDRGDQMLKEFGKRVRAAVPADAHVARLRADQLAVLLPEADSEAALSVAAGIEAQLVPPYTLNEIPLPLTADIGVATFPQHGCTARDLLRHMDIAVQQARRNGVLHAVFDPSSSPDPTERLQMAAELRRAIDEGDLRLFLQPKVEMETGKVCGAEALVRWMHANRGLIPPSEFITLAEQTGLIFPLTDWVLVESLRLVKSWAACGQAWPVAVNLSMRSLRDDSLLAKIRNRCVEFDVSPKWLQLEITESAVMDDAEFSMRVLQDLRSAGHSLHVDDFGTGYSSLSYLQKLPVDCIKIDQSFVRRMTENRDSALIVRSTIDLIHDLGHKVVAEGVETIACWQELKRLGCDVIQGYLISKPMPADQFMAWTKAYSPPHAPTHMEGNEARSRS